MKITGVSTNTEAYFDSLATNYQAQKTS